MYVYVRKSIKKKVWFTLPTLSYPFFNTFSERNEESGLFLPETCREKEGEEKREGGRKRRETGSNVRPWDYLGHWICKRGLSVCWMSLGYVCWAGTKELEIFNSKWVLCQNKCLWPFYFRSKRTKYIAGVHFTHKTPHITNVMHQESPVHVGRGYLWTKTNSILLRINKSRWNYFHVFRYINESRQ